MSVLKALKLEHLQTELNDFPFPFIHFTLPKEGGLTFSHEVSHLLQFKQREVLRWLESGKFFFKTEKESHFRKRRECETEAIEYKLSELYATYYLTDSFFRESDNAKVDRYYLTARKRYTKRLLKKRAKFINKIIAENSEKIAEYRQALNIVYNYIQALSTTHPASIILNQMFCSINNTYDQYFDISNSTLLTETQSILDESKVPYEVIGTSVIKVVI